MHPSKRYKIKIFSHCSDGVMKPFSPQELAFKHKNISFSHSDVLLPSFFFRILGGGGLSNTRQTSFTTGHKIALDKREYAYVTLIVSVKKVNRLPVETLSVCSVRFGKTSMLVTLLAAAVGLYLLPSPIDPKPHTYVWNPDAEKDDVFAPQMEFDNNEINQKFLPTLVCFTFIVCTPPAVR